MLAWLIFPGNEACRVRDDARPRRDDRDVPRQREFVVDGRERMRALRFCVWRGASALLAVLFLMANPCGLFAGDEKSNDRNSGDSAAATSTAPAKSAPSPSRVPAKMDAPAPLSERERW